MRERREKGKGGRKEAGDKKEEGGRRRRRRKKESMRLGVNDFRRAVVTLP